MKRIARGLKRYVIDSADPFIVKFRTGATGTAINDPLHTITAGGHQARPGTGNAMGLVVPYMVGAGGPEYAGKPKSADAPFNTLTTENHTHLVAPTLIQTGYGERVGQAPRAPGLDKPLGTVVAGGTKHAVVGAFLAKHFGGNYTGPGADLCEPSHTVTATDHHALVTAYMQRDFGGSVGHSLGEPSGTVTAGGGGKSALVSSNLIKLRGTSAAAGTAEPLHTISAGGTHHAEVRAFLVKYYSEGGQDQDCREPMHTIPTKDRLGLVTVAGQEYQIADIGMRMLEPHELYAAQGFPSTYIIAPVVNGKRLPKHAQVRMCGNSVCPPLAKALVAANVPEMATWNRRDHKADAIAA